LEFFNQKEEVIDVQLTQFGKRSLARGRFKPEFYEFFDDDILYNSLSAGFNETQNDTQNRILKETPRLKTIHQTSGVLTSYIAKNDLIDEKVIPRYETIVENVLPEFQEKILLYPLSEQETAIQAAPHFLVTAQDAPFVGDVSNTSPEIVESGIVKDIPKLELRPVYYIERDRSRVTGETAMVNQETFIDLTKEEITFSDNSQIRVNKQNIMLDVGESNTFYEKDNFYLTIFHVQRSENKKVLVPLRYLKNINKLFHIKTDEDIGDERYKGSRQRGNYNKGDQ
tara:strand:- start:10903 stop:11751 length:849 start_codon:yes stop_codon:yes gene_type:complete